ncbi:MAG: hypothetical protein IH593_14855, partial [Bacteroidales bacterium]|nr:hypothetical protein [Bacteroidales bacterium]
MSNLDPDFLPMLYCAMKSVDFPIPASLEDFWNICGTPRYEDAVSFYNKHPYRLIRWVTVNYDQNDRVPSFVRGNDIRERALQFLKKIVDKNSSGLLKTLLYTMHNDFARIVVLAMLIDVEGSETSTETRALKKIILTAEDQPLVFDDEEFPYALMFYFLSDFRQEDIIRGFRVNTDFGEAFLRQTVETKNQQMVDSVSVNISGYDDIRDPLLSVIGKVKSPRTFDNLDKLTLSRIVQTSSLTLLSAFLSSYFKFRHAGNGSQLPNGRQFTEEDIDMLLYLFGYTSIETSEFALGLIASDPQWADWLKPAIHRWFNYGEEGGYFNSPLPGVAITVAGIIKSEEY